MLLTLFLNNNKNKMIRIKTSLSPIDNKLNKGLKPNRKL